MSANEDEMPEEHDTGLFDYATKDEDYRWKGLSTIWSIVYGFGFPAWLMFSAPEYLNSSVDGTVTAFLALAWGATVVYIIGPENVKAWKEIRKE